MLQIVGHPKLELHEVHVVKEFIHGEVEENIYMEVPDVISGVEKTGICELVQVLFGLKQAPRKCNFKIDHFFKRLGLDINCSNHFLYVGQEERG